MEMTATGMEMRADGKHARLTVCKEWSRVHRSSLLWVIFAYACVAAVTLCRTLASPAFVSSVLVISNEPAAIVVLIIAIVFLAGFVSLAHELVHVWSYRLGGIPGATLVWDKWIWKCVTPPGVRVTTKTTVFALLAPTSISMVCTLVCFAGSDAAHIVAALALLINACSSNWDFTFASIAIHSRKTIRSGEDTINPAMLIGHP